MLLKWHSIQSLHAFANNDWATCYEWPSNPPDLAPTKMIQHDPSPRSDLPFWIYQAGDYWTDMSINSYIHRAVYDYILSMMYLPLLMLVPSTEVLSLWECGDFTWWSRGSVSYCFLLAPLFLCSPSSYISLLYFIFLCIYHIDLSESHIVTLDCREGDQKWLVGPQYSSRLKLSGPWQLCLCASLVVILLCTAYL
jgi:hypothetical protein